MRKRHALAATLTCTLAGAVSAGAAAPADAAAGPAATHPAPAKAAPAGARNAVAVTGGHLTSDGTVTVTGTYRCVPPRPGAAVFVGTDLRQDGHEDGIGGTRADCDGREHSFSNSGRTTPGTYRPGPARLAATLVALDTGQYGVPVPQGLASAERPITLVERKG